MPPIWSTVEDKRLFRRSHSTIFTRLLRALFHKQHNYNRNYPPSRHNSIFNNWSPLELEFLVPAINKASEISKKLPIYWTFIFYTTRAKMILFRILINVKKCTYKCKDVKINSLSLSAFYHAFLDFVPRFTKIFSRVIWF